MNILVINCGSSSLKYQLINSETEDVLAKGLCERIGIDGILTYQPADGEKEKSEKAMPTHTEAIKFVLEALTNEKTGVIKSLSEVGAVGHRIVHGGEKFTASTVLTAETIKAIEECSDLAPLHNPANLIGVRVYDCEGNWTNYDAFTTIDPVEGWDTTIDGGDLCHVMVRWNTEVEITHSSWVLEYDEADTTLAIAGETSSTPLTPYTVTEGTMSGSDPDLIVTIVED